MILNIGQANIELGTVRVVEKFALLPRRINNQQCVWLQRVKVTEVYSEVACYDNDYGGGFVTASKKWIETNVSLIN
jgi:hypothetical protein